MLRPAIRIAAAACLAVLFSIQVLADTTPEDAADYRQSIMTAMRGHVGAISMIARGLVENHGQLVNHAKALDATAKELSDIFPEGSNVGDSEALPLIWEDPEGFEAAVAKLQNATSAFVAAAEEGDQAAIGTAFRNVGMSCRGCHDRYRADED